MGCEQSVPVGTMHISEMYREGPPVRKHTRESRSERTDRSGRTTVGDSRDVPRASSRFSASSAQQSVRMSRSTALKGTKSFGSSASTASSSTQSYRQHGGRDPLMRSQHLGGLWEDEAITTARIPLDKVIVKHRISRGGYGEVFFGYFKHQKVAVKTLLPETRRSVEHVNAFLAEVKMMAAMDHPRIVQFVGVAWDSVADLCVVSEYMEGGDLRSLLVSYKEQGHPHGFDQTKATIALHIAHALTYLHSLDPPVVHRDLKSKNILLSAELEAKLTDFGVSRERADRTMTAGVGTSLWMAPEVMLGEKYDDKADVFSFGVVLSELDTHVLPYSQAKENSDTGRSLPETAILQMVLLGKLRAEFSTVGPKAMVALGEACMAMDPKERPTAAEALYKLQTILANGMQDIDEPDDETREFPDYEGRESDTSDCLRESEYSAGSPSSGRQESPRYVL